ncbi:hypothetical protein [Alteriqipengyuania sp.]|uniref:hypothetical protein n=2 Tax=Sphingomonadales TaxID=204457 RepID=UPI0035113865
MFFMAAFLAPALGLAPVSETDVSNVALPNLQPAYATETPIEMPEASAPGWLVAEAWRGDRIAHQVRIRQQITIRVSPRRPNTRELVANWREVLPQRYEQRKIGKCVPARSVVGVQTVSSRDLVLYLSDSRMIRAQLRKSCNARDFYLGFMVEPNEDGNICAGRDTLRARTGATCKIEAIRQLVPVE